VTYRRIEHSIAGVNGSGLFDPESHGLHPVPMSTANWRGYVCSYSVRERALHLRRLQLGLDPRAEEGRSTPPPVLGVEPDTDPQGYAAEYRFTRAPISFTGGLLLGAGFIQGLYVHMGFHPVWKFRQVIELIFDGGRLSDSHDHSGKVADIREEILSGRRPDPDATDDLPEWISRTFELDYSRTFD
jgi:hypothetical protein